MSVKPPIPPKIGSFGSPRYGASAALNQRAYGPGTSSSRQAPASPQRITAQDAPQPSPQATTPDPSDPDLSPAQKQALLELLQRQSADREVRTARTRVANHEAARHHAIGGKLDYSQLTGRNPPRR